MFWKPAWSARWLPPKTGCLGQRVLGYADQSHGDVDVWQECGRAPAAGSPESRAFRAKICWTLDITSQELSDRSSVR
jgi:hypothetical protein